MAKRTNRVAWGAAVVLSVGVVTGAVQLLSPYWVARFRGNHAKMQRVFLPYAPLRNANLVWCDLQEAHLAGADLRGADLRDADLRQARLVGARLTGAQLQGTWLQGTDLTGADLTGACYDSRTHWPAGFNPQQRGALRMIAKKPRPPRP